MKTRNARKGQRGEFKCFQVGMQAGYIFVKDLIIIKVIKFLDNLKILF